MIRIWFIAQLLITAYHPHTSHSMAGKPLQSLGQICQMVQGLALARQYAHDISGIISPLDSMASHVPAPPWTTLFSASKVWMKLDDTTSTASFWSDMALEDHDLERFESNRLQANSKTHCPLGLHANMLLLLLFKTFNSERSDRPHSSLTCRIHANLSCQNPMANISAWHPQTTDPVLTSWSSQRFVRSFATPGLTEAISECRPWKLPKTSRRKG